MFSAANEVLQGLDAAPLLGGPTWLEPGGARAVMRGLDAKVDDILAHAGHTAQRLFDAGLSSDVLENDGGLIQVAVLHFDELLAHVGSAYKARLAWEEAARLGRLPGYRSQSRRRRPSSKFDAAAVKRAAQLNAQYAVQHDAPTACWIT